MEQKCYFVNSRGLLKSCYFHSNNPKSSCNNDKNYLLLMIKNNNMFDGMSIYICSDLLHFFVLQILPIIKNKFNLVSGDSDLCAPREALNQQLFNSLINNPLLNKWFIQNTQIQNHDKIIQLPIGLDYHTISNDPNHSWKSEGEGNLPRFQEEILFNIRKNMKPFNERNNKIYVNFSKENDRFGQRKTSLDQIPQELLIINNNFTKRTQNWKNITKYTFVLSPFGIGMDCHRTWESICLGCIPILKAPNFKNMFEELPVLIVNEWSDITKELLDKTILNFQNKIFNYDKLTLQYWVKKINII